MHVTKEIKKLLLFIVIYWILCLGTFLFTGNFLGLALAWNVFLGILPFLFIQLSTKLFEKKKKIRAVICMILWLFFFPNSIYLLTDFIHLSNDVFYKLVKVSEYQKKIVYIQDIAIWIKLFMTGIAYLISVLIGYESFYIFEKQLETLLSRKYSKVAVWVVSFLTGIAIYIGRFLRFNSWDLLANPFSLLEELYKNLDLFAWEYIVVVSLFTFISYKGYKLFIDFVIARRR